MMTLGRGRTSGAGSAGVPAAGNRTSTRWIALVLLLFVLLGLVNILRHEMWLDELDPWLAAKDSSLPWGIILTSINQSHPPLWYLCLHLISRVWDSLLAMQLFHLGLATAAAFVLLKHAPFPRLHRVLLVFGYYLAYEYCVISRNYALVVLFLFLFCSLCPEFARRPFQVTLFLSLMAFSHDLGAVLALCLGAALGLEVLRRRELRIHRAPYLFLFFVILSVGLSVYLAGLSLSAGSIAVPAKIQHTSFNLGLTGDVLGVIPKALLPVPPLRLEFWNSYIIDQVPGALVWQPVLGLLALISAAILVRRRLFSVVYLVTANLLLLASFYVTSLGYARHRGFFFLVLLSAVWLSRRPVAGSDGSPEPNERVKDRGWGRSIILGVLVVQLWAGVFAMGMDFVHPFSPGRDAARILKKKNMHLLPALAYEDTRVLAVVGYLGRPVYYLRSGRVGAKTVWGQVANRIVPVPEIMEMAERMTLAKQKDCLLILSSKLESGWEEPGRLVHLADLRSSISRRGVYLYLLKFKPIPLTEVQM